MKIIYTKSRYIVNRGLRNPGQTEEVSAELAKQFIQQGIAREVIVPITKPEPKPEPKSNRMVTRKRARKMLEETPSTGFGDVDDWDIDREN